MVIPTEACQAAWARRMMIGALAGLLPAIRAARLAPRPGTVVRLTPQTARPAASPPIPPRGVPATEVARAGHDAAVLLKIYAHCIDGQADAANQRITDALGVQDTGPSPNPVTGEMTAASRHPEMPGRGQARSRADGPRPRSVGLRARPWAGPPRSVDRTYPGTRCATDASRTAAARKSRLEQRKRWSAA